MLRWEEVVEARVLLLPLPRVDEVAAGAGDGEATAIALPKRVSEKARTLLGRVLERADAMKRSEDCLIIIMVAE